MASAQPVEANKAMTEPYVRPDVQGFLDMLKSNPRPTFTAELLAMIRKMPPDGMARLDLPVGELGEIRDVSMPGPGGEIKLRMFDARKERAPGPVVVFYHGGGFVVGGIETHAGLAAEIARVLDLPVVSVEYRLAPEHPWPAAPDDAEAAARWIAQNGTALGRNFTELVLSGDSAGGNLTLVTALALRDKPAALPVIMQFPLYPGSDHGKTYPSGTAFADGYGMESANIEMYNKHYAGDPKSWRYSPLLADQSGLPPTLLVTAALDPLRDQGRAYAAKLVEAGVRTTYREIPGMIHGFASYRGVIPSARGDTSAVLALAKEMLDEIQHPDHPAVPADTKE